jgi:NAD(P)H-dependent FMN reductase
VPVPVPLRIVAISGSLRRRSTNGALIGAAAILAPPEMSIELYEGLGQVPPFNPDTDDADAGEPVRTLRRLIEASDAVLISSPEYAHGVPGALKNALDWLVGSGELVDKPVAVMNASPRATFARASLIETLSVMSARVVEGASITLPLQGRTPDPAAIAAEPAFASALRAALLRLADAVRPARG